MITPTKGIAPQRALLAIGAQIIQVLEQPLTVSQTWAQLKVWRSQHGHSSPVPFWWFALALDVLFALGTVDLEGSLLVSRRADAASTPGK